MWYEVAAKIPGAGCDLDVAHCFDPTIVVLRLQKAFPTEITVCIHDYAWDNYDVFTERKAAMGAIRVAENDARRRGPVFIFRLRTDTNQEIIGRAERYAISISSQKPIPDSLKRRFIEFLKRLNFEPSQVRSVRIDGNTTYGA